MGKGARWGARTHAHKLVPHKLVSTPRKNQRARSSALGDSMCLPVRMICHMCARTTKVRQSGAHFLSFSNVRPSLSLRAWLSPRACLSCPSPSFCPLCILSVLLPQMLSATYCPCCRINVRIPSPYFPVSYRTFILSACLDDEPSFPRSVADAWQIRQPLPLNRCAISRQALIIPVFGPALACFPSLRRRWVRRGYESL